ncbi:hypothetical protein ACI77J_23230 [Pseudomonas sp. O64]|uniref:hypothetical protein n=2 Tax=Pseudomonas TaxID=286 RepID=UPI000BA10C72|nr:hypothetical protein [Pseudomonas sp. YeP6b]OZO02512.1 hypothetical protein B7453_21230 [Pseudomonas sp. IB20]UXZ22164.1 hypothetical protein KZH41_27475 [Pseudomonas sp. YeP6b]
MRYLFALAGTALVLTLISGCDLSQRLSELRTFGNHPIVDRTSSMDSTQQDILNIQKPTKITSIRGGTAQCFDYALARDGKRADYFVSFTSSGWVNAWGYATCSTALAEGSLASNERVSRKY